MNRLTVVTAALGLLMSGLMVSAYSIERDDEMKKPDTVMQADTMEPEQMKKQEP
ncbi:hypothetical protein ACFL48_02875 [Pseudomonadota bacterium]